MRIELEETETKGRYVMIDSDGGEVGEMTFSKARASLLVIDHTEVAQSRRGRGLGEDLVVRAVKDARASGRRIRPLCSFARKQFDLHPEWQDVLSG